MNRIRHLSFKAGPIEYGWGDFTIEVDDEIFHCQTSRIGDHPVARLVSDCCELYSLYQDPKNAPTFQDSIFFEVATYTEPGGLLMTFEPEEEDLLDFHVYDITNSKEAFPSCRTMGQPLRQVDGLVSVGQLIEASYRAAAELLGRHGITGFHARWICSDWFAYNSSELFPIGHFLFLDHIQQQNRVPRYDSLESSLNEDIEILRRLNRWNP